MSETVVLNVNGMKCGGCESNIKETLSAIEGVESVSASHKENTVEVTYDASTTDLDAIKQAITGAGFEVE